MNPHVCPNRILLVSQWIFLTGCLPNSWRPVHEYAEVLEEARSLVREARSEGGRWVDGEGGGIGWGRGGWAGGEVVSEIGYLTS